MALLSTSENSVSLIDTINPETFFIVFLIIILFCLVCGLIWLLTIVRDFIDEKKKYYRNLNRKLVKESKPAKEQTT